MLTTLCNVIAYGKLSKREPLVDWRYSYYAPKSDPQRNVFYDIFEAPHLKSYEEASDGKFFPAVWNKNTLKLDYRFLNKDPERSVKQFENEGNIIRGIIEMRQDVPVDHIVVTKYTNFFNNQLISPIARLFKPLPHYDEKIKNFIDDFKKDQRFIGIHLRDRFGSIDPMPDELLKLIDAYHDAIVEIQSKAENIKLLFASDSPRLKEHFKDRYGDSLVLIPTEFNGHSFQKLSVEEADKETIEVLTYETLRDMWLMSECEYFIGSTQSAFARFIMAKSRAYENNQIIPIQQDALEMHGKNIENTHIQLKRFKKTG